MLLLNILDKVLLLKRPERNAMVIEKSLQKGMGTIKKSFLALAMSFALFALLGSSEVYAAESETLTSSETVEAAVARRAPATVSVNKTITDVISQGGCWASIGFNVSGTYTYEIGTNRLLATDISTSVSSAPSDWIVAIDSTSFEMSGTNLVVKISYHYKASYYDCAFTGGYVYTMVQGTV